MRHIKHIILAVILMGYSFLYIATSYDRCDDECEKFSLFTSAVLENRNTYVNGVLKCGMTVSTDTICVYVKDTTGINWNLFADTVCAIAAQKGYPGQNIYVIKNAVQDTVAFKNCP